MDFKELKVWRKARELTVALYKTTADFPHEERFGLTSQIRRAVISIVANLAEGSKKSKKDYARFVNIAQGSAAEIEALLFACKDLDFIDAETFTSHDLALTEIQKMLHGLHASLETSATSPSSLSPSA
jgi:four helix bundle protein